MSRDLLLSFPKRIWTKVLTPKVHADNTFRSLPWAAGARLCRVLDDGQALTLILQDRD